MYPIEDLGLLKIDLLSQRSLGVVKDVMNQINRNYNSAHPEQSPPNIMKLNK